MDFHCSRFFMNDHILKEKCNETRKVIEKGLLIFPVSSDGDGGMLEDEDNF